eukprot:g12370.t1
MASKTVQRFCCLKTGKGCPSLVVAPLQVKQSLFDCEESCARPRRASTRDHLWDWTSSWTQEQKDWCCQHEKKGCKDMGETKVPPSEAHIPDADFQILLRAEQLLKRQGLNWETLRSEPSPGPSVSQVAKPFRCDVALENFQAAWSKAKKSWCCKNEQKGCASEERRESLGETGESLRLQGNL